MKNETNYSLLGHNTFGIDARCSRFLEYGNEEEARQVAAILRDNPTPYLIIGGGSNLLLTRDYEGTVVRSDIRGIAFSEDENAWMVRCGSGETWDDVVAETVKKGLPNLANLSLIPGDVGASVVQNIGAYGAEVCQFVAEIEAIEVASGKKRMILPRDCHYGYRESRFKHEWKQQFLITHVTYRLDKAFQPSLAYGDIRQELERRGIAAPTASELRQAIIDIRRSKLPDPREQGNAGSFFMNPVVERHVFDALVAQYPQMPHYTIDEDHEKIPAGWMIEQCGWKGKSLGRAGVHHKQALVLVNLGGATGAEIVELCNAVRADVKRKFGIEIKPEVNVI